MPIKVLMPALSPTMDKGNLSNWLKKEGDSVKPGDILAEIETDKATMEIEAIEEGVLAKILVPSGTADVPVNQLIALIAEEGEDPAQVAVPVLQASNSNVSKPAPTEKSPSSAAHSTLSTPAAAPEPAPSTRLFASPLARRLAHEANIDLTHIQGSGPRGRIIERDVRTFIATGAARKPLPAPPPTPSITPSQGMSKDMIRRLFEPGSFEEIPHDSMRLTIARRLTEAKQTIPHFYLSLDCEIDALLNLREQINASAPKTADGKPAFKISVNDFVIKALALALIRVPNANASWTDTAILRHKHADVAVAVAIPGGLITPVIRKAETKSLSTLSYEMKDYAARAKARKLKPEEYQGGSSAVSNLGMFGIKNFSAVINPPHATILAVGAGEQRVIVKNGMPSVANMMSVTLSTDHRVVDGALGAELLSAFKQLVEAPMGMLI